MEVRYIEIKTSPAGQIIRAYTPEQYKKEMARRKNAAARARKLTRLQERVGAVLAMLGFLMLAGRWRYVRDRADYRLRLGRAVPVRFRRVAGPRFLWAGRQGGVGA